MIESGQLTKRKLQGKDLSEVKSFVKEQEKFEISQGCSIQKELLRQ